MSACRVGIAPGPAPHSSNYSPLAELARGRICCKQLVRAGVAPEEMGVAVEGGRGGAVARRGGGGRGGGEVARKGGVGGRGGGEG